MNLLFGHTNKENAKEVTGYPWGYKLKTSRFYWIESNKKGDRMCYYTIDPRNGKTCETKKDVYHTFAYLYINDEGHVKQRAVSFNCLLRELRAKIETFLSTIPTDKINEQQQTNVRNEIITVLGISPRYMADEYTPERFKELLQWCAGVVKHILNCEFKDIAGFPEMPKPDFER